MLERVLRAASAAVRAVQLASAQLDLGLGRLQRQLGVGRTSRADLFALLDLLPLDDEQLLDDALGQGGHDGRRRPRLDPAGRLEQRRPRSATAVSLKITGAT